MTTKQKDKNNIKTILVVLLLLALLLTIATQIYYSSHLTKKEITQREVQIKRFAKALVIVGDFKVNADGTVDYTITKQDDAQLNYNLYAFYMEKNDKFPLYTAEDLWAEIPLDTWNPPENAYIWNYSIWDEMMGYNLAASWASVQHNIKIYNGNLQRSGLPPEKQKDVSLMTPAEIARFSDSVEGTGEWEAFHSKWTSGQPITEADLID